MMPEGWELKKLSEITDKIGDGIHATPQYCDSSEYFFINGNNLNKQRIEIFENTKCVSEEEYNKHFIKLDQDTILMSINGTIGNLAFYNNEKVILGKSASFIRVNPVQNKKFIMYYLQSKDTVQYFNNELTGTTIRNLSLKTIRNTPILLPPLPEQRKIASILSSVDDAIQATQKVIDQTERVKRGLLQELLTRGIGHTEFKQTEIGEIPVGWEVMKLISLAEDGISNGVFNDPKKAGDGYSLINVVNLYDRFEIEPSKLKKVAVSEKEFTVNKVKQGDIFFTRSSLVLEGIARCNIFLERDEFTTFDGHIMRIRPNQNLVVPLYLKYFCLSYSARSFFMSRAKTATMTTIGQKDIAPLPVLLPELSEQKRIVKIIQSFECEEKTELRKFEALQQVKKGLMQDLLTGKVRVII